MQESTTTSQTDILYRSKEELRAIQDQRFRHQISLCFKAHPYYQEVFSRLHLKPEDFQTLDDVHKLPVTTKADYMKNPLAFRLTALPEFTPTNAFFGISATPPARQQACLPLSLT